MNEAVLDPPVQPIFQLNNIKQTEKIPRQTLPDPDLHAILTTKIWGVSIIAICNQNKSLLSCVVIDQQTTFKQHHSI